MLGMSKLAVIPIPDEFIVTKGDGCVFFELLLESAPLLRAARQCLVKLWPRQGGQWKLL